MRIRQNATCPGLVWKAVGERLSQLDTRLLDFWNAADEKTKAKAIRILSELA